MRGLGGPTHLILDIQRAFLFMEELQGLDVAVSGSVVDSVGSALKVPEGRTLQIYIQNGYLKKTNLMFHLGLFWGHPNVLHSESH